MHCWVADEQARKLPQVARVAIAEYLTVVKVTILIFTCKHQKLLWFISIYIYQGGENNVKKVNLFQNMHPSLKYVAINFVLTMKFF